MVHEKANFMNFGIHRKLTKTATAIQHFGVSEICPGLTTNEMHTPHDRHHKVSSLIKVHQNTHNFEKNEVI